MNKILAFVLLLPFLVFSNNLKEPPAKKGTAIPSYLLGRFEDDYGITYTVTEKLWLQEPNWRYHIIKYDSAGQFFIVQNDKRNPYEPGKFSRIDIAPLTNMRPYLFGYCLITYDARTADEAENSAQADRNNLKKGCGGFPFSRMKRIK